MAVALLGAAAMVRWACVKGLRAKEQEPRSLVAAAVRNPRTASVLLVPLAAILLGRRARSWRSLGGSRGTRGVVLVAAVTLVWPIVTARSNPMTARPHARDRWLLITLTGATLATPLAIPLLLAAIWVSLDRLGHPVGMWAWADVLAPIHALVVMTAAVLLRAVGLRVGRLALPVAIAVHSASYVHSAVDKLRLGWPSRERPSLLLVNAYLNGHLANLDETRVFEIEHTLARVRPLLVALVLSIELSSLGVLLHRRAGAVILLVLASFHAGIAALSGIFFWPWIAMNAAFAHSLMQTDDALDFARPIRSSLLTAVVMLVAPALMAPARLAWLDTPLVGTFVLEAEDDEGRLHLLPRAAMSPYDAFFTQGRFPFLLDALSVVDTFGETRTPAVCDALSEGPHRVADTERRFGTNAFDAARAERFDELIVALLSPERRSVRSLVEALAPSATTRIDPRGSLWALPNLRRVRVRFRKTHYDGQRILVLEDRILRVIELCAAPAASEALPTSLPNPRASGTLP